MQEAFAPTHAIQELVREVATELEEEAPEEAEHEDEWSPFAEKVAFAPDVERHEGWRFVMATVQEVLAPADAREVLERCDADVQEVEAPT